LHKRTTILERTRTTIPQLSGAKKVNCNWNTSFIIFSPLRSRLFKLLRLHQLVLNISTRSQYILKEKKTWTF